MGKGCCSQALGKTIDWWNAVIREALYDGVQRLSRDNGLSDWAIANAYLWLSSSSFDSFNNRLRTNLYQIHVSCFEGRGSLNDDLIELESLSILLIFSTLSERLQLLLGDVHEGHINLALLELGHICFFVRFCFEVVLVINR